MTLWRFFLVLAFSPAVVVAEMAPLWILGDDGISRTNFDQSDGSFTEIELLADLKPASWLVANEELSVLYAGFSEGKMGGVVSYRYDDQGNLSFQSRAYLSDRGPTHIALHPEGLMLACSHYWSGTVSVLKLSEDGSLAGDAEESSIELPFGEAGPAAAQTQARAHWAGFSNDGKRLVVTDLGGDALWTLAVNGENYRLEVSDRLAFPAGAGPRHLAFHPDKPFAFVNGEIGSKLFSLAYDESNSTFRILNEVATLGPDDGDTKNNTSEVLVHPNGASVFVANRGHDSISVFNFDFESGAVVPVERESIQGEWPRNFTLDTEGKWMIAAGRRSDSLTSFRIDSKQGELSYSGQRATVAGPVRVLFVPTSETSD